MRRVSGSRKAAVLRFQLLEFESLKKGAFFETIERGQNSALLYTGVWYIGIVIEGIQGKTTQNIFDGINSKAARKLPSNLHQRAQDLLDTLNAITSINDLKSPPSNRLHKLKDDLKGYWSISINDQWRIIFQWDGTNANSVEIVDYH